MNPTPSSDLWLAPHAQVAVDATVTLPGSKSLTNRELLLGSLADGPSVLRRALRSRDTELMAAALRSLGAGIDTSGADWHITPAPLHGGTQIDCGLAGTVMRFVPPVAALATGDTAFDGDAHARLRPMAEVLSGLGHLGVQVSGGPTLPFTVHGRGSVPGGRAQIDASASSQFVSALLLAGAKYDEGVDVLHIGAPVPSLPHIDMTVACLRARGVEVVEETHQWQVAPGPIAGRDLVIEPDLSNAAPFLMLAMIAGGTVVIRDWPEQTTQAGDHLREVLAQMGARFSRTEAGLQISGTGAITGIDADLHDHGELTPAIAALCALAETPSRLRGIAHIRGHETDRLAALAAELTGLGASVVETDDGLEISPATLHGGVFHTYADHRMAHAGLIIGAAVAGVQVENVATTSKTFPGFAQVWESMFEG